MDLILRWLRNQDWPYKVHIFRKTAKNPYFSMFEYDYVEYVEYECDYVEFEYAYVEYDYDEYDYVE